MWIIDTARAHMQGAVGQPALHRQVALLEGLGTGHSCTPLSARPALSDGAYSPVQHLHIAISYWSQALPMSTSINAVPGQLAVATWKLHVAVQGCLPAAGQEAVL